ncbi:hypothetical protein MLD38_004166 [Melastoma candidum]|uniref:Uncharacterized protein n=1 Tax=Melastoma candidum TaxID=119954 RepID=A0ACB9S4V9_9MYRT|nr:hypothetical protein MLD38_004166 [Melastoma candidum]
MTKGPPRYEVGVAEPTADQSEDLRPSGARAWNNLWVYKLVPWLNWDEWDRVRVSLFSSSPESVACALDRISAWKSRGCLPVAIEATAAIFVARQKDPFFRKDKPPEVFCDSEEILVSLYAMSIQRLVNGTIEKTRKRDKSMADAAEAINIPRMLIDIRHEASHREFPSLPVLRDASIVAIEWLKQFYWEPQIFRLQRRRGVTFEAGKEVGISFHFQAREVAEAKVHRALYSPKDHNMSSSLKVLSDDDQHFKKGFAKTVKFLGMLYCSYPLEVASVLLELFLKEDIPRDHEMFGPSWKYLTEELSKKRPQLLITLLNVVIDMIEAQDANKFETGKLVRQMIASAYGGKPYPAEQLYMLAAEVVSLLKQLKPFTQKAQYVEAEVPTMKEIPRAMLVALARRFLGVATRADNRLMDTAMEVVKLLNVERVVNKLSKLPLLSSDNADAEAILCTSAEQKRDIQLAYRKLEAVRNISRKKMRRNRWRIAKFWSPCPIGMLPPDADFSHSHFPILDPDSAELQFRQKREADWDEYDPSGESRDKRSRTDSAEDVIGNGQGEIGWEVAGGGCLMMDGSWKRVGPDDIQAITSSVRLLLPL